MRLWIRDNDGLFRLSAAFHNDIVLGAKQHNADLMRGHPLSSPIRAFALGSDATPVAVEQTQLVSEVTRKTIPAADVNTSTQVNILIGNELTLKQVFGPGLSFILREVSLFGDIVEIDNPAIAPIVTPSESGGTLAAGTYAVVYTWNNNNGETIASPSANAVIVGSTGKIDVTIPALPATATQARIYAAPSGTPLFSGFTVTTTYAITSFPGGSTPPVTNTAVLPGEPNSGRMIDRAVLADRTILTGTVFTLEVKLIFS